MSDYANAYELRCRLQGKKDHRIVFDNDLTFEALDYTANPRTYTMTGVRLGARGNIITEGNGCPQLDIQYDDSLCREVLKQREWQRHKNPMKR